MSTIYEDVATLQEQMAAVQSQISDTGWLDLPLAEGITQYNEEQKPRYRRIGNEVFLSGVFKGVTANNTAVGTLPEGFRPSKKIMYAVPSVSQCMSRISIDAAGVITHERATVEPLSAPNWHSIACIFTID